jgi:hypothetical protein
LSKINLLWPNELWKNRFAAMSFAVTAEKTYLAAKGFVHTAEKKYLNLKVTDL